MAMSGIPYWTLDAGAFFTGTLECWRRFTGNLTAEGPQPWFWHGLFEKGVADLGYRELYTRWLQMAAYLPVMRSTEPMPQESPGILASRETYGMTPL